MKRLSVLFLTCSIFVFAGTLPLLSNDEFPIVFRGGSNDIISVSQHSVSPDKKWMVVLNRRLESETRNLRHELSIVDVSAEGPSKNVRALPGFDTRGGGRLIERFQWRSDSQGIYFTLTANTNTVFFWNIESGDVTVFYEFPGPARVFSVSPRSGKVGFVTLTKSSEEQKPLSSGCGRNSYVINDTSGSSSLIARNIDCVPPIWVDDANTLFISDSDVFLSRMRRSPRKLFDSKGGEIVLLQGRHKAQEVIGFHVIVRYPLFELGVSDEDQYRGFVSGVGDFRYEIWYCVLEPYDEQMVLAYRSQAFGATVGQGQVFFEVGGLGQPLSTLVRYRLSNRFLEVFQDIDDHYRDPVILNEGLLAAVRNRKELVLLPVE